MLRIMKIIIVLIILSVMSKVAYAEAPEGVYQGGGMELWFEDDTWLIFLGIDSMGEVMVDYGYWEERSENSYYLCYDDGDVAYIFELNNEYSYLKPGYAYLLLGLADEDHTWGLTRIDE